MPTPSTSELCSALAYMYQYAGATGADSRVLDNLAALANGEPAPHEWEYPAGSNEFDQLKQDVEILRQSLEDDGTLRDSVDALMGHVEREVKGFCADTCAFYPACACGHADRAAKRSWCSISRPSDELR